MEIQLSANRTTLKIVKDGTTYTKDVELPDLVSELRTNVSFDFGLLPPSTRYVATSGLYTIVAVELPSGKRDLNTFDFKGATLQKKVIPNVALPASLFIFILKKHAGQYSIVQTLVFALETDRIVFTKDRLYFFPTPNVYSVEKHHAICWGDENKYNFKSLAGVEGMVRTFLTAPFNTDLFGTDKLSMSFPWNKIENYLHIDEYFRILSEEPVFKQEWLKPATGDFENFEKALSYITKTYK